MKRFDAFRIQLVAEIGSPDLTRLFTRSDSPNKVYCVFTDAGNTPEKVKVTRLDSGLSVLCTIVESERVLSGFSGSAFFTENDDGKTIRFSVQKI